MDTLTHVILGATLAHATATKTTADNACNDLKQLPLRSRLTLGGLAAAFPDIDYLTYLIDPLSFISNWHRAETHSFIMLPIWALLLAYVFSRVSQRQSSMGEAVFICGLSIGSHILSDLITSWGTQIFAPLSAYRASLGTTFVIDPYFSLILVSGLIMALVGNSRRISQIAIITLLAYVGMQSLLKQQANNVAHKQAIKHQWQAVQIHTLAQPLSPFNWKIIIAEDQLYHLAYIDLIAATNKPLADNMSRSLLNFHKHYRPESQLDWSHYTRYGDETIRQPVVLAWQQEVFARYRQFAQIPAFIGLDKNPTEHCYWFMDLRFVLPQYTTPFSYGACRDLNDKDKWIAKERRP